MPQFCVTTGRRVACVFRPSPSRAFCLFRRQKASRGGVLSTRRTSRARKEAGKSPCPTSYPLLPAGRPAGPVAASKSFRCRHWPSVSEPATVSANIERSQSGLPLSNRAGPSSVLRCEFCRADTCLPAPVCPYLRQAGLAGQRQVLARGKSLPAPSRSRLVKTNLRRREACCSLLHVLRFEFGSFAFVLDLGFRV